MNVFITGMGVLTAHGLGVPVLMEALQSGVSHFKKTAHFPTLSLPVIAALLNEFNFEIELKKFSHLPNMLIERAYKAGRRAPLTIQASLLAALEAWSQARLAERTTESTRIGLVVAGQNTTQAYQYQMHNAFHHQLSYLPPTYALHFMDTDQIGTLSEVFNIQGEGFTVGGASASGNVAIIQACRLIQQGLVDICLVVGTLADLSPLEIQGFHHIGALGGKQFQDKPEKACRPFDTQHEGFIWGQASGCLVLESLTDVRALATIAGTAMNLDANRLANPNLASEIKVMRQALANAKLSTTDLQYINTHGSSSPLGDHTEIKAIKEVWGDAIQNVWLNSTKSITGHCLWSAGIIEAIATILQIENHWLHPNLNLEIPIDDTCQFIGNKYQKMQITSALTNSFGFGGINTSIVISSQEN